MTRRMLINATAQESRVAIVEGRTLEDLHVESIDMGRLRGNIYKGTVVRVEPAIGACFVDFGGERNGFLAANDVTDRWWKRGAPERRPRIEEMLSPGMHLIVQVTREPEGNKGAALTTSISLPGRYSVLLPDVEDIGGISKKIQDESERKRLKSVLSKLGPKLKGHSTIIRTEGQDRTKAELERDLSILLRFWSKIVDAFKRAPKPGPLFLEQDVVVRSVRDYFTNETTEVLIDNKDAYERATAYVRAAIPRMIKRFKLYEGKQPLLSQNNIENQIEQSFLRQVPLPSGGSIVIDRTEALVAIDINSGRAMGGSSMEETALNTNVEAATEIARQLRLRDLGGLVVIDFIDMRLQKNQRKVVNALTKAMKPDKARHNIGRISQFGLLEMSRQRIHGALDRASHETCKTCTGTGLIRTMKSCAEAAMRRILDLLYDDAIASVQAVLPVEVAIHLLNERRHEVVSLEQTLGVRIEIYPDNKSRNEIGSFYGTKGVRTVGPQAPSAEAETMRHLAPVNGSDVEGLFDEIDEEEEVSEEQTEERKKRRRRRRRRGRRNDRGGSENNDRDEESSEEADAERSERSERSERPDSDEQEEDRPRRKRRRRRRRRRDEDETSEKTEESASSEDASEEPSEDSDANESKDSDEAAEERPRRKRRRRRGRRPGSASEETAADTTDEASEDEGDDKKDGDKDKDDEKKERKPRRGRRRSRKDEDEDKDRDDKDSKDDDQEDDAEKSSKKDDKDDDESKERKRRPRRSRKKKDDDAEKTDETSDGDTKEASSDEVTEEKPKRTRRKRTKRTKRSEIAAEVAETAETAAKVEKVEEAPKAEEPAEEEAEEAKPEEVPEAPVKKPRRARRTSRKTKKAVEAPPAEEAPETEEAPKVEEAPEVEEAPKASEDEETPEETPEVEEAEKTEEAPEVEEAPKKAKPRKKPARKPRRTTTRRKTAKKDDDEAAADEDTDGTKKRRRRGRSLRDKAEEPKD